MSYEKLRVVITLQCSQHNGKLPLPHWKKGNYPVIPIYDEDDRTTKTNIKEGGNTGNMQVY